MLASKRSERSTCQGSGAFVGVDIGLDDGVSGGTVQQLLGEVVAEVFQFEVDGFAEGEGGCGDLAEGDGRQLPLVAGAGNELGCGGVFFKYEGFSPPSILITTLLPSTVMTEKVEGLRRSL